MSAHKKVAELTQKLERAKVDAFDARAKLEGAMVLLRRAEAERDEARSIGVWVESTPQGRLIAVTVPAHSYGIRRVLTAKGAERAWGDMGDVFPEWFPTEAEALAAGYAVPWWEVRP